jgi:hypothetical protein
MEMEESISLKETIETLGERVFGISILLFCIPNCVPIPNFAGLSAFTGIPIGIIGLHMMVGKSHLWLPASLGNKQFSTHRFGRMLKRAVPTIQKTEVLLHPRLRMMSGQTMQRLLGVVFVILATIMSLPIPFGNFMPGLAMALIAIGLIERDGVIIVIGLIVGVVTVALMLTAAEALASMIQSFLG